MMTRLKSSFGFLLIPLLVTACTPPMPPEFKAELAERYVTCVPGEIAVSTVPELLEVTQSWVDGLSENCSDLTASIVEPEVDVEAPADVFITAPGQIPECNASATSPVGIDAVAVSVSVEGLDGVIFTPALLHRALSGGMTSWADPELQELNPEIELSDTPVVVRATTRPQDAAALNEWMSRIDSSGWPAIPSGLVSDANFDVDAVIAELETEGTIAIVPASLVTNNSLQTISIQTQTDVEPVYVTVESVISAGTQMVATTSDSFVTAELDASLPPIPAAGNDVASLPWQALNQFTMTVCTGSNEEAGRAFARYALRLESQGAMTSFGFTEMPEQVRIAGVDAVSQGLPEPTIPPSAEPEEAPEEISTDAPTEEVAEEPSEEPTEEPLEEVTDEASPEPTS
jgi:ABC-type phosphate transport system substrate-binding protein